MQPTQNVEEPNGFLDCDDPDALQRICDRLSAAKINAFFRRWLARLPHPFTAADRRAGYRYELSVLQAEFSLDPGAGPPPTVAACSSSS